MRAAEDFYYRKQLSLCYYDFVHILFAVRTDRLDIFFLHFYHLYCSCSWKTSVFFPGCITSRGCIIPSVGRNRHPARNTRYSIRTTKYEPRVTRHELQATRHEPYIYRRISRGKYWFQKRKKTTNFDRGLHRFSRFDGFIPQISRIFLYFLWIPACAGMTSDGSRATRYWTFLTTDFAE